MSEAVNELSHKPADGRPARKWYVTPPELMPWISSRDRDNSIVLLDFEPDVLPSGELRFDLRVAFKCIPVRQKGLLAHVDFYIGCTSASVQLDVDGEQITAHSQGMELTVNYKNSHKRTRESKASLEPSIEFKSAAYEGKVSTGGISLESGSESVFECSFAHSERYLAPVNLGSSVIWRLDPPICMQVVRDFLFCNLHIYAVCTDSSGASRGRIKVRPSDLRFYGPDRHAYVKVLDLMMRYSLFKARRSIYRPEGIVVKFSEVAW